MSYHEVPPDVLENREELVAWAHRAIQIAADSKKSPKLSRQIASRASPQGCDPFF
jgi:TfoX/Sxy family transcriptional regulator of competence genes